MLRQCLILMSLLMMSCSSASQGQDLLSSADSLRIEFGIPEIGYAVVSADSVLEISTVGFKRIDKDIPAGPDDRFHIGSNTKAITGLIAALLVKQQKLAWDTKFFDLLPELRAGSDTAYYDMSLVDLLGHRSGMRPFTEEREYPDRGLFLGSVAEQRRQFVSWALRLRPVETTEPFSYSNAGYSAAAIMLEKASGRTWEELVSDIGSRLGLDFGRSFPNIADSSQTWGHLERGERLIPVSPDDNENLELVAPAGDINMSIRDYAKFVQIQLLGLEGRGPLLNQNEYEFLHCGLSDHYAIGWSWGVNARGHHVSAHTGSAGTFFCMAFIFREADRGYILMANSGTEQTENGLNKLLSLLAKKYGT